MNQLIRLGLVTVLINMITACGSNSDNASTSSLNDGLVAHYEFEGNANDSSGNKHNGTAHGGVTYTDGVIGKAANFDGDDDWIELEKNLKLIQKDYTMHVFIKPNDFGSLGYTSAYCASHIFSHRARTHRNKDSSNSGVLFSIHEGNYCDGTQNIGSNFIGEDDNAYNIVEYRLEKEVHNKWISLTIVRKGEDMTLYMDNKIVSTSKVSNQNVKYSNSFPITSIGTHIVSDYSSSLLFFLYNGKMDDLRIYNRALNQSEVQALYKMGIK